MKKISAATIAKYAVLILISLFMVVPVYIVVMMGTYRSSKLFLGIPWIPGDYLMQNLKTVFASGFLRSFANSLIVSVGSVLLCVICCSMVGFALAKYEFRIKKFVANLIIMLLVVPTEIGIIGYVREMRAMGLVSTYWPLIFLFAANPFCAFFMESFMADSFPTEIMESSRIDGCSEPGIFFRMALPMVKPGIATVCILVFLWSWNSYMLPLIIVSKQELYTIPLFVSTLSTSFNQDYGAIMCALGMAILPMLVVFTIFSKNFMDSITVGALKG